MLTVLADDWHPARLFRPGDQGGVWDFRPEYCRQNSDGTGAAAVGSPVGWVRDLSGNGLHLSQSTTSQKPILNLAATNHRIEFDDADDVLYTQVIDNLTFYNACSVLLSLRWSGSPYLLTLSRCCTNALWFQAAMVYAMDSSSNIVEMLYSNAMPADEDIVYDAIFTSTSQKAAFNGVEKLSTTNTFNFGSKNDTISIGAYQQYSSSASKIYAALLINRPLFDWEMARARRWFARRAGITL